MERKIIAYCRVSTTKQGLGLDEQLDTIEKWAKENNATIIKTIEEKESGKETTNRPGLMSAIDLCRQERATIVVSKLDRLSRDVADIFVLKRRGVPFECCDIDASDTMLLGIFSTLAQKEREMISSRTKKCLKAKYSKPGESWHETHDAEATGQRLRENSAKGVRARRDNAKNAPENKHAYMAIRLMDGTLQSKADFLNENGYRTREGRKFAPVSVSRLLNLYAKD